VDWLVEANVSEKLAVSIFRAEVLMASALKMESFRFSKTLAYTNQSTRRLDPKEYHQSFSPCSQISTFTVSTKLVPLPATIGAAVAVYFARDAAKQENA
jgi:hypothetical protein